MTFMGYVDEINPKYVICLSGTNDINRGYANLFKFTHLYKTWLDFFNKSSAMKIINEKNNFKFLIKNILNFNKKYTEISDKNFNFQKPPKNEIPLKLLKNKIDMINSICEKKKIFVTHILQPDLIFKKFKSKSEIEYINFLEADRINYFKEQITILRDYFKSNKNQNLKQKINFIDLTEVFDDIKETIYFDKNHFTDRGYKIISKKIADEFYKNLN